MAEVTGILGDQPIELNNAATEATLKQLLAAMIAMGKAQGKDKKFEQNLEKELNKLAKQAKEQDKLNADAIKKAKEKAKLEEDELKRAKSEAALAAKKKKAEDEHTAAVGKATEAAKEVGRELFNLAVGGSKLLGTLGGLNDSITGASNSLGSIPLVGGLLTGVLGSAAEATERVYENFKKVSSVGATFGGNMTQMMIAASGAGLTIEQFSGIVTKNAEGLTYFGGTTEQGAKRLAQLGKEIKNSRVGSELLRMGYSTEQINDGMAGYIGMLGRTGSLQNMTTSQLAAASGQYMKELDALAKITGSTREEKQKEQEALMKDAQFRVAIRNMDAKSQQEMINMVTSFPAELQPAIKDMIATGNMTTEDAIKLNALMPGAAKNFMEAGRTIRAGGKITTQGMDNMRNAFIDEAKSSLDRNETLGLYSREYDKQILGMANMANKAKNSFAQTAKEQAKTAEQAKQAEAIGRFKQQIADASNAFTTALMNTGALDALQKAFGMLTQFAMKVVVPAVGMMVKAVSWLTTLFDKTLGPVVGGLAMALAPLGVAVGALAILLKPFGGIVSVVSGAFRFLMGPIRMLPQVLTILRTGLMMLTGPVGWVIAGLTAAYAAMQYFNVDLEDIANFISDNVMDAFTAVSDFLEDVFAPAFQVVSDLIDDIVMPAFRAVGAFLQDVFYGAVEAVGNVFTWIGDTVLKPIGDYLSEKLAPAFKAVGEVVNAVGSWFKDMYNKMLYFARGFDSLGTVTTYLSQMFDGFSLFIKEMVLALRDKLSWMPGITKPSQEERDSLEKEKQALAEAKKNAEERRNKVADRRTAEEEARQQDREKKREARDEAERKRREQRDIDHEKRKEGREKAAEDEKNKTMTEEVQDYSGPVKMLQSYGRINGSNIEGIQGPPSSEGRPAGAGTSGTGAGLNGQSSDMQKYLKATALVESGGNAGAKAGTSSAAGLFQFTEGTWKQMTKEMGKEWNLADRFDPKKSAEVAAYFTNKQKGQLEKGIGREASSTDLYMSHFLGAGGATKFLNAMGKDPNQSAAALDPKAAAANKSIYYTKEGKERSLSEVYALMNKKITGAEAAVDAGKWGGKALPEAVAALTQGSTQKLAGAQPTGGAGAASTGTPATGAASTGAASTGATTAAAPKPPASEGRPTATGGATVSPVDAMNTLVVNGINPTTVAFQDLIKNGLNPLSAAMVGKKDAEKAADARRAFAFSDPRRVDLGANPSQLFDNSIKAGADDPATIAKKEKEAKAKLAVEKAAKPATAQETAESLLSQLNMKMDQLIDISGRTHDLNDRQLSVQRGLSGDMFSA